MSSSSHTPEDLAAAEADLAAAIKWLERAVQEWNDAYSAFRVEHGEDPPRPSNGDPRLAQLREADRERCRAEDARDAAHARIREIKRALSNHPS